MLKSFESIIDLAKQKGTRRLVVAAATDRYVLTAVMKAKAEKIIEPILFGRKQEILKICADIGFDVSGVEITDIADPEQAPYEAVSMIRSGQADIMMKGMIDTKSMLKAILDKEKGLRKGAVVSHVALFESPYYHKLIGVTDAAMPIVADLAEKVEIINNAVEMYHRLGVNEPKIAVLGPIETINPKMEATVHAAILAQMNQRKQIKGCIIDGPLALDNAVLADSVRQKGIVSNVAGDADLLVTHDINSGNILYKSLNFLGGAASAAVVMGAKVPIVLTSRADPDKSKLMSIALAAAIS